jgi:hypothetical protein
VNDVGVALFPVPASLRLARTLRWQYTILFVLGVAFWGAYLLHEGDALHAGYKMDFVGIYAGARMLATGAQSQLYDMPTQAAFSAAAVAPLKRSIMPFVYPAYVALILKPLGMLQFLSAMKVWFLLNVATVLWVAMRLARFFGCTMWQQVAVLTIFLAWPPLQLTLVQGQMGLMPTLAFTESLVALQARREWRAGCWLSLGLMKPQMILLPLLWFLLRRSWRVLGAFSAVMAVVVAISIAALGFWIPQYLHFLAEYNRRGAELALYPIAMQNWRGLSTWIFQSDDNLTARFVIIGLTALSALGVWFAARQSPEECDEFSARDGAGYAVAIVLGLLSSPHLYSHDWVAALPAGFLLWSFARGSFVRRATGDYSGAVLLWQIGLSPLVFFIRQFMWPKPIVPIYGILFVGVALRVIWTNGLDQKRMCEEVV